MTITTPKTDIEKRQHKRDRFKALLKPRLNKLAKAVKQLANLGNTSNYLYSKDEGEQIARILKRMADDIDVAFNDTGEYPLTKITFDKTELD
tara:strand:- start:119 stop:394 length:276 start_codon:yes stop_codon:yes gene_type:complete